MAWKNYSHNIVLESFAFNFLINWLILKACQPVLGYFYA